VVKGVDGSYVIDVTARFSAMGASFLVLIECKHERRKVERQAVQVLHAKMVSTWAQKGMLFSVAGFQSGAVEYATVHGIARHCTDSNGRWELHMVHQELRTDDAAASFDRLSAIRWVVVPR